MDFSKYFDKFKARPNEKLLPSLMLPLEIDRWSMYKKLVGQRSSKYLLFDKEQFIMYLRGTTIPFSRVYENHPLRGRFLNPLYDISTNSYPLWEDVSRLVHLIGYNPSNEYTIKGGLNLALKGMIKFLESLDGATLDDAARQAEERLTKLRDSEIYKAVTRRQYLSKYPQPEDLYV